MKFSANLGFLWTDLPLPEAIEAAAQAGFDAVECHAPYDTPAGDVAQALRRTGLPMMSLNTRRGAPGESGLAALPGRETEARAAIEEAVAYARAVGARAVHVMAGVAGGAAALEAFRDNLAYATAAAPELTILIEPLNRHDAPGYFLMNTDQAIEIIGSVGAPNLKLMFDCYHVERTEGGTLNRLETLLPHIGHIQFAAAPDRGPPGTGAPDYGPIFARLAGLGYDRPLGAEYRPPGKTEDSLGWMARYR